MTEHSHIIKQEHKHNILTLRDHQAMMPPQFLSHPPLYIPYIHENGQGQTIIDHLPVYITWTPTNSNINFNSIPTSTLNPPHPTPNITTTTNPNDKSSTTSLLSANDIAETNYPNPNHPTYPCPLPSTPPYPFPFSSTINYHTRQSTPVYPSSSKTNPRPRPLPHPIHPDKPTPPSSPYPPPGSPDLNHPIVPHPLSIPHSIQSPYYSSSPSFPKSNPVKTKPRTWHQLSQSASTE